MQRVEYIKKLREKTGAPLGICREAAGKYPDDERKAVEYIKLKMQEKGLSKSQKATSHGVIGVYLHGVDGRVAAMVEVRCQTDFATRTQDLQKLAKDLAMHVAAMKPIFISSEDIPQERLEQVKSEFLSDPRVKGKPPEIAEKIVQGMLKKWYEQVCLLEQEFFKGGQRVKEVVNQVAGKLGENIKVVRFIRWEVGE